MVDIINDRLKPLISFFLIIREFINDGGVSRETPLSSCNSEDTDVCKLTTTFQLDGDVINTLVKPELLRNDDKSEEIFKKQYKKHLKKLQIVLKQMAGIQTAQWIFSIIISFFSIINLDRYGFINKITLIEKLPDIISNKYVLLFLLCLILFFIFKYVASKYLLRIIVFFIKKKVALN